LENHTVALFLEKRVVRRASKMRRFLRIQESAVNQLDEAWWQCSAVAAPSARFVDALVWSASVEATRSVRARWWSKGII